MNENLCYTCGSCEAECPVNRRTNKLSPRKIVRYKLLGLIEEACKLKDIWYCVQCGRCALVCPMSVKPVDTIETLRHQAVRERHLVLERLLKGEEDVSTVDARWRSESQNIHKIPDVGSYSTSYQRTRTLQSLREYLGYLTNITLCWSCGSCSNACPAAASKDTFSPMHIFRLVNWGFLEEAAKSTGVWLCFDCGRCMEVCPQNVKGLWVIRLLRNSGLSLGTPSKYFLMTWFENDVKLHKEFINRVEDILMET